MPAQTLRLHADEALHAVADVDLLEAVGDGLFGGASTGVLVQDGADAEYTDSGTGQRLVMPAATLRTIRTAGVAGLAARMLRAPGVATAAVFGSGAALDLQIAVLARYVANLSHIAVCSPERSALDRAVLDEVELAGIGLSTTTDPRRAAFGANLLVVLGGGLEPTPSPGMLLVNASGTDLPADVVGGVDHLVVDELSLLAANGHRAFAALHEAGPDRPRWHPHREGWHRTSAGWRDQRRIEADLGALLRGSARGRVDDDDILLVELLGSAAADDVIAGRLHQAAIKHGCGRYIT